MEQIETGLWKSTSSLKRTSKEVMQKVIELYLQGHSQNYIEKDLGMTRKTIRSILKLYEVQRSKKDQTYFYHKATSLREDAFDLVTDESAYWIGFLYADGYITNPEQANVVGCLLKESDIGHLEKLRSFLKSEHTIYHDQKNKNVKLKIGSQRLHQTLQKWGFTHNKSYNATPPEFLKYNRHFWRGVIDGDGYLGEITGFVRLNLCGTKEMMNGFREFLLLSGIQTQAQVRKHPEKSLHIFEVGSNLAKNSLDILYKDSTVYLDRKYNKYLELVNTDLNA